MLRMWRKLRERLRPRRPALSVEEERELRIAANRAEREAVEHARRVRKLLGQAPQV